MSRRAAAVEETRRRIIDATLELHAEQGIAATGWDAIAARAGVGVGTVYRHFPSLDELVPACGRVAMELLALPDPAHAPALFAGVEGPRARLERLVGDVFAIYERGAHVVRAVRFERDVHPHVARDAAEIDAALAALVDAALEPLDVGPHERRLTRAMVDILDLDGAARAGARPGRDGGGGERDAHLRPRARVAGARTRRDRGGIRDGVLATRKRRAPERARPALLAVRVSVADQRLSGALVLGRPGGRRYL